MEGTDDLELSDQDPGSGSTQSVRKNIALKLKRSPKGRGRSKKGVRGTSSTTSKKSSKKASVVNDDPVHDIGKSATAPKGSDDYDDALLRDDVLHLAVSGIKPSSSQEPIHQNQRLNWHHKVTFVGEKVVDPLIHCCEKCTLPILIYGRMIPCKHVFCFDCAKKTDSGKICPRCKEQVVRIDQSALGTVFVCNIGGTKHGRTGCRRTYLSPRDLKAHIDHRHLKPLQEQQQARVAAAIPEYKTHSGGVVGGMDGQHAPPPPPPPQQSPHPLPHHDIYHPRHAPPVDEPRHMGHHLQPPPSHQQPPHPAAARHMSHPPPPHQPPHPPPPQQGHHPAAPHPAAPHPPSPRTQAAVESYQTIPVMSTSRSANLITVPIQDEAGPYRGHADQRPPPPQQQHPQPPPPPQPGLAYPPAQGHPPPPAAPYAPQGPPPRQQYHTAHPLPPHSSGAPPFSTPPPGPYNPAPGPHHAPQPGLPPLSMAHSHPPMSQPPPMTSSAPMGMPSHHGPPPPQPPPPPSRQPLSHPPPPQNGPPPPQHYSSSRAHYEDQHPRTPPYMPPGGHSPRTPWGNNQPRGPPPPRVPASNTSMPPPPRADGSHYKQYYQ